MRQTTKSAAASARKESKHSVAIIGAGRLGTALGIALRQVGYQIDLVVAKHAANARRSAKLIGSDPQALSLDQLTGQFEGVQSSILAITTPDDAIAEVAKTIALNIPSRRKPANSLRVALHTSGALDSSVLQPLQAKGLAVGSFHPLISISNSRIGAEWFGRAFFGLEGDSRAVRTAKQLVRDLGARSFMLNSDQKALYHAAALMASPNTTALLDIVVEMLNRCGLTVREARHVLLPLVQSTLENLATQSPSAALTGTFKRGDIATVRKHISALKAEGLEDALGAYVLLGKHSLAIGKPKNRTQIEALLNQSYEAR